MGDGSLRDMVSRLRRAVAPEEAARVRDGDLVARWVAERDEAAFELLVWRHGPALLATCRRMLRNSASAEDAFQATWLTFVNKAASIGRRESVAGWLFKVAYRVSLRARAREAKRLVHDQGSEDAADRSGEGPAVRELRAILDEEVARLPDRFRVPFALHYLEGRTNEETARELNLPVGTVVSRLVRARDRLRRRLANRGVTLSATAPLGAAVVLPESLLRLAVAAAEPGAAAGVSVEVISLSQGVVRDMLHDRIRASVSLLIGLLVLASTAGALAYRPRPEGPRPEKGPPPAAQKGKREDETTRLLKEKVALCARGYAAAEESFKAGRSSGTVYPWSKRWVEAELELHAGKPDRLAALEAHATRMKSFEKTQKAHYEAGSVGVEEVCLAGVARAEAELWVVRARAR